MWLMPKGRDQTGACIPGGQGSLRTILGAPYHSAYHILKVK